MNHWKIEIERWPYSGVEQEDAGDRRSTFVILADDISQAFWGAQKIQLGIESSPKVWRAPIISIARVGN